MIYLDNAATTCLAPEVLDAMMPYLKDEYGNPGSLYGLGRRAADAVAKARKQVADFIGANPEQIIFTSGGTEANNLAITGTKRYLEKNNKKHIITSSVEHESVLKAVKSVCNPLSCNDEMCTKDEFYSSFLGVDSYGRVSEYDFRHAVTSKTGLVSVMYANNEVGVLNQIQSIGNFCRRHNILLHTDCVQAAGTHVTNVDDLMCDFLSLSSHKIHGPKGVGALYVRDKKCLYPIINGGGSQEFGLRGGTENVAGIVGFGKACELASGNTIENAKTTTYYKKHFYELLKQRVAEFSSLDFMKVNGLDHCMSGKTLNIMLKGIDAETLVLLLDTNGVCVSAGSACQSHESKPSHVLTAMGLTDDEARSSVRISFSEFNEIYEIERAAKIFANCIKTIKGIAD